MRQRNQQNEMLHQINRDDTIDIAEHVNNGIDGDEGFENEEQTVIDPSRIQRKEQKQREKNEKRQMGREDIYSMISENKLLNPTADTSTQTLLERIPTQTMETQPEPEPEETTAPTTERLKNEPPIQDIGGGGGGPSETIQESTKELYISQDKKTGEYIVTVAKKRLGRFDTLKEAIYERDLLVKTLKDEKIPQSYTSVGAYKDRRLGQIKALENAKVV
jgi:hypothetical protein